MEEEEEEEKKKKKKKRERKKKKKKRPHTLEKITCIEIFPKLHMTEGKEGEGARKTRRTKRDAEARLIMEKERKYYV